MRSPHFHMTQPSSHRRGSLREGLDDVPSSSLSFILGGSAGWRAAASARASRVNLRPPSGVVVVVFALVSLLVLARDANAACITSVNLSARLTPEGEVRVVALLTPGTGDDECYLYGVAPSRHPFSSSLFPRRSRLSARALQPNVSVTTPP